MMRYLTNPLSLLLSVWTVAGVLYLSGTFVGLFPPVEPITVIAVVLSLAAFALGYLTWSLFRQRSPVSETEPLPVTRVLYPETLARLLKACLLMGILAMLAGLYRISVIATFFDTSVVELLTHPTFLRLRLVMYIDASQSHIDLIPIVISLTSSFLAIGFVLLGVYLFVEKGLIRFVYLASFLFVSLFIGLTNLSRYEVTVNVLYLVFAYGVMYASARHKSPRDAVVDLVLPLVSVVLLFAIIDTLLGKSSAYGHVDRLRGTLFSFYWYVASPLAAFNEFLLNFEGPHHYGQYLFFPFYKWLNRFALVPDPEFSFYSEMTFLPFMTNVYTYLRNVYEDFGMIGIAVVPYGLGWITCALRPKACRSLPFLNVYLILLVLIIFSFYNYYLVSNQMYLQALFGFLFFYGEFPAAQAGTVGVLPVVRSDD